jgi:hypothetical protein
MNYESRKKPANTRLTGSYGLSLNPSNVETGLKTARAAPPQGSMSANFAIRQFRLDEPIIMTMG